MIAFRTSGLIDIVDHLSTGYLAELYSVEDLATGIAHLLEDSERTAIMGKQAREKAEREFSLESVARRYREVYEQVAGFGCDA